MKKFLSFVGLAAVCCAFISGLSAKTLLNIDKHGVALQGYDPVAFFTDHQPVKGEAQWQSAHKGAIYYFASAEHKAIFDREPARYEPQFGGYCAFGVTKGHAAPIRVDAFQIVDGRLLLQYNKGVRDKFNQDKAGNLKMADAQWPAVIDQEGK
jgi:YHS domain-containing protein